MKLAIAAMLPLILLVPATAAAQRPRVSTAPASTTATTITVTDLSGAPLADVRVNLIGALDRSGSTQSSGTVWFDGLRPGTYRLRFNKEGFVLFERELEIRAGQAPPNPSVALSPGGATSGAHASDAPKSMTLPPPGKPVSMAVPDFIEKNFISNAEPQKVSTVGCSGVANTVLWQIREPWNNRQHAGADAMLYVIGGEGTIRLDGRDTQMQAGSFASVPRGTSYSITRRGRNPLIVLATLAGEACQ